MKFSSLLAAVLFAGVAATGVVHAEGDKAAAPKAADAPMEKPAVKPHSHSHVQDKTGMPQSMPKENSDKPSPVYDKTKHNHPRDMK